jgi:hypothetical protein
MECRLVDEDSSAQDVLCCDIDGSFADDFVVLMHFLHLLWHSLTGWIPRQSNAVAGPQGKQDDHAVLNLL